MERLSEIVYAELRRLASYNLRAERQGHLLQPSALVKEGFSAADERRGGGLDGSGAFLRFREPSDAADSGGEGDQPTAWSAVDLAAGVSDGVDLLDVDGALEELARLHPRQARVVELRFFGGLENGEVAECLGISDDTVMRDWRMARAWLFARLRA